MPSNRIRHHSRVAESWQNFLALMNNVSAGHELAFRQALFSSVGQFFLLVVVLICYELYLVLQTFVKPLVWAALTGTVLFPLKSFLSYGARGWIHDLKSTRTPLTVGLFVMPFHMIDRCFNFFGAEVLEFGLTHYSKIIFGFGGLLGCFLVQLLLWNHMDVIVRVSTLFGQALELFSSKWIWCLVFIYVLAVNYLWIPQHRRTLRILAWVVWVGMALHLLSLLGSLAAVVLLIVFIFLCLGFATEWKAVRSKILKQRASQTLHGADTDAFEKIPNESSFWQVLSSSVHHLVTDKLVEHESSSSDHNDDYVSHTSPRQSFSMSGAVSPPLPLTELKIFAVNREKQGTRYMLYLFWMFVLVNVWTHYYVIPFLLIPVAYRVVRLFGHQKGVWLALADYFHGLKNRCKGWIMSRRDIVAPTALRGLVRLAKQGDHKVLMLLEDCVDESVALLLVLMVFVAMGAAGLLVTMQVHQETVYIVGISSDFMNETIVKHPELMEWLPEGAQIQENLRAAMDSAYMYARDWIVGSLREAISDSNTTRAGLIEKDILTLADRVYQFYVPRNRSVSIPHGMMRQSHSWGNRSLTNPLSPLMADFDERRWSFNLWSQLNHTWHKATVGFDWSAMSAYVKNNIETLYSVIESVWGVCKGNFAMAFSLITTILSIFLMYFSALIHFIFCGLVYIAALYYLLSSSKERFRPLDLVGVISPSVAEAGHVAEIIEQTISDIFAASFKMAAFYGFFTWVLLSLFGIYIRFIPSVLASMLAVCPLVPPYVACIPALCELWFLRGEYILAILMALGAVGPSLFVDIAIYGDVNTAHPYMFGLSVAGGIVTMGLEGAVFGPVMLCILMVIVQVYRRILSQSSLPKPDDLAGLVPASDTLVSPNTPSDERKTITDGFRMRDHMNRQESVSSYPAALLAVAEQELEDRLHSPPDSPDEKSSSEPSSEMMGARRRVRMASFGSSTSQHQSTPKDGSSLVEPDFTQSPINRTSL